MVHKKTLGLLFSFVFITSMFMGISVVSLSGGDMYSALMAPPNRYCTITNPSNGETVLGVVTITVDASATPRILIDGVQVAQAYSYDWDTTAYSDGSHTIEAKVPARSDIITVTVSNGGGGNNAPVVTITAPADGATISGTYQVSVSVSDEDTLVPDIYIDGAYITTSYTYDWDTTAYSDGSHTVYAEATDSGGLTGSDTNTVTVDNTGGSQGWSKANLVQKLPWWNDVIDVEKTGYTGSSSVVVILDTGLVSGWTDYFPEANILTEYSRSYTKELGKDNVEWNQDTEGHGTAVTATVIGYRLFTSTYEYWIQGVAEDAKIVMLRVLYWIGGFGPPSKRVTETELLNNWADAIDYARSLKSGVLGGYNMIVSMSLGYDNTNSKLNTAIANAEDEGIVVCTSAGNSGPSYDTTGYPANLQDTTSVAAAGYEGFTGAYGLTGIWTDIPEDDFSGVFVSEFSSRGKVDVTAIGENLVLPYSDGYYYISGTSFSCPQTSGVYALMFEAYGAMSVSWLESRLQSTAIDLGYDVYTQGAGFIQADGATG